MAPRRRGDRARRSSSPPPAPGMSLMAEAMSYMAGSELPIVLINVMRGGPGLGSIGPSQSDYFQATKGHGHGDYRVPVLAPASIAEAVALVADSFEIAARYRTPVILLADGIMGQAMEPVVPDVPDAGLGHLRVGADRRRRPRAARRPLAAPPARGPRAPQHPPPGEVRDDRRARGPLGGRAPRGRRDRRRRLRHRRPRGPNRDRARPRRRPARRACSGRSRCGRSHRRRSPSWRRALRALLVVELSAGQMVEDVRLAVEGATPVFFHGRTGGMVPTPDEVVDAPRVAWALTAAADDRRSGDR